YCQLKLDSHTAHKELYISEGNRKVIRTRDAQPYSDNQDRFDSFAQVAASTGKSSGVGNSRS
ncbi:hypothetical protein M9458_011713, partial [Cirrhinus mrigala]